MVDLNSYFYSAYGLTIKSSIELPGFVPTAQTENIDVNIFFNEVSATVINDYLGDTPVSNAPGCDVRVSERVMCFQYATGITILIADGSEVMVDLTADATVHDVLPYLTGYVLSVLLHQRRLLVLHASVMRAHNRVVAFLGAKGYGKSTLAASLKVRGHELISDDNLPIVFEGNDVLTLPGYPQIKLFADSVTAVGGDPLSLRRVHSNLEKYSLPSTMRSHRKRIPLSAIYVLNVDENIGIKKLSFSQAFIAATTHTHANYYLKESNSQQQHFEQCQNLVQKVPFFQLDRPHNFSKMYAVTEILEQHVSELDITSGQDLSVTP